MWGSKILQSPPTVTYEEAMDDGKGLFKWLSNIVSLHIFARNTLERCSGSFWHVLRLKCSPNCRSDRTASSTNRFHPGDAMYFFQHVSSPSFNQFSLDGKFWDFTSDMAHGDTAYTTLALEAHTDNTYFVRIFLSL